VVNIYPIGAIVRVEVFAAVLEESSASAHREDLSRVGQGLLSCINELGQEGILEEYKGGAARWQSSDVLGSKSAKAFDYGIKDFKQYTADLLQGTTGKSKNKRDLPRVGW
jgi:hypothetical protein